MREELGHEGLVSHSKDSGLTLIMKATSGDLKWRNE